eukprot:1179048-Prorocentrum_minimum.AAC.1
MAEHLPHLVRCEAKTKKQNTFKLQELFLFYRARAKRPTLAHSGTLVESRCKRFGITETLSLGLTTCNKQGTRCRGTTFSQTFSNLSGVVQVCLTYSGMPKDRNTYIAS